MTDQPRRQDALAEILSLYSITLSIGASLDLRQNCRHFVKALRSRRKADYAEIWVKRSLLTGSGDATGARLVYASHTPGPEGGGRQLQAGHPIVERLRMTDVFSLAPGEPDYQGVVSNMQGSGAVTVFALENIGVLAIIRPEREAMQGVALNQLRQVVQKFTRSVADCLAYERLVVSESKYRALFEESRDAVFISTPEGRFLSVNPAGARMLGYSVDELRRLNIGRDIFEDINQWEVYRTTMATVGHVKDHELVLRRKNGERLIVQETSNRVRDDRGAIVAYRGIMRDVTEQRRLQEQLAAAQKLESLGQLAGGIAHDFNNLLTGILGYTSLLETKLDGDPKLSRYLGHVSRTARRAQELTSQLLGFARRGRYEPRVLRLEDIALETVGLLKRVLPKTVTLNTELGPRLPNVEADASQLQQVIMNLCLNARDAMPSGGHLTLRTDRAERVDIEAPREIVRATGPFVRLTVEDTGIGMDEETAGRVFEPFFTTKPKGRGTGLGLALVYGVTKNHGGFVSCHSQLGVGTTFRVYLPASGKRLQVEESTWVELTPSAKTRGELVLVVDDEAIVRSLARDVLEGEGYRVLTADDGAKAVEMFQSRHAEISLVVLDMIMPNLDGVSALRAMRESSPTVRAVMSTGFSTDAERLEAEGVQAFLRKPYSVADLLATVREVLDTPAASTSLDR